METVHSNGKMEVIIKENLKIIKYAVMENSYGMTKVVSKVNGKIIR
jgi:hypothetical protein